MQSTWGELGKWGYGYNTQNFTADKKDRNPKKNRSLTKMVAQFYID